MPPSGVWSTIDGGPLEVLAQLLIERAERPAADEGEDGAGVDGEHQVIAATYHSVSARARCAIATTASRLPPRAA